ncbi:hypothetical protein LTEGF4_12500 [Limnohabitans sp. TEGF004]|nr:hypothetical protein LTEGF4_12500 [Limnohabitans sp. TEGF004]
MVAAVAAHLVALVVWAALAQWAKVTVAEPPPPPTVQAVVAAQGVPEVAVPQAARVA